MGRSLGWRAEQTGREPMRSLGRPSVNSKMLSARFGRVLLRDYRVRTQPCHVMYRSRQLYSYQDYRSPYDYEPAMAALKKAA